MPPDAVLSALVEVKRAREATREIAKVQAQLKEATREANIATAAVNRFGRVRGIAVLDVNAAKAQAQTAAAQKAVHDFGRANGTATLDANGTAAHRAMAAATSQLQLFARTNGTATLDANAGGVTRAAAEATAQVRAFGGLSAEARANLKIAGATAKISQLRALLADLESQDPTIEVRVQAAKAVADLERAEAARRKLTDGLRDTAGPAREASRALAGVGGGGRDGGNGIAWLTAKMGDLPGRIYLSTRLLGAMVNILLTMAPVVVGLAAQFVALASAMAPIAGLAAGVGGAMVAAAQGMAVFKLATMGVGDAIKASGKDAEKYREELEKLPPAAQAFTRAVVALKPRLDELRATAAGGFFPGASAGLSAAMGSFAEVNRVVGQTSTVLGDAARKSGELVGSPAFGRDIEIIGGRNATVLATLGEALRHLISGIRHLLVSAGPLTQWLADVTNAWALNFAAARKAGRETGKTAEFFEKAKATAQLLGSILSNLGSAFMGIGRASEASGRTMLESLDRLTERFAAWANSVRGRNDIAEFMESARKAMAALSPAFGALVSAFTAFAMNVLPVYAAILRVLEPLMDELVTTFLLWKVAATGAAIATTALKGAMMVAAFVTGGWTTAFWALNAALVANPIGIVVVALAALVAGLVLAYRNSETFRRIVDGALRVVGAAFMWMLGAAKDVLRWLASNWQAVGSALTGPVGAAAGAIAGHVDEIVGFFKALPGQIADAIKAGAAAFASAVAWIKDQIVGGIKAYIGLYVEVGRWLVNRLVDGVKAMAGALADAAGWVKNRIIEGVRLYAEAWNGLGGWIVNRIVEGIKIVGEALASVGGWLKNRIVENVHLAVEGFKALGGWVLNRIVEGFKVVTEALSGVGGWVKNRLVDAFGAVKDGFLGIGGSVMDWIVDGLKRGANKLVGFLNKILSLIEKIPGIKDGSLGRIDEFKIDKDARGGTFARSGGMPGATEAFAHGGAFARTGGLVSSPITLMGEEAPRHPEFVIPTNPAYRGRAQMLLGQAAGAVGLAEGGVVDAFRGAIKQTGAGPKPSLALWMAGIVESGLRNLTYGHADSLGALQVREGIHGRALAMNPFASALAFLTRGFTGRGGAIKLAGDYHTAGQVAQAVQGSAFPDRYDAVREQAEKYMKGGGGLGGIVSSIGGAIGDLLSKGAGFLLDKLPGVGDLPDWLKGTGRYVLDKAGDWIRDKVKGLVGAGGGGDLPGGVSADIKQAIAFSRTIGNWTFGPGQLFRPGGKTYHGQGRAADFGDAGKSASEMRELYGAFKGRYGKNIKELFYDPMGEHVKNGRVVGSPFGGHGDHVHLALAQGGVYGPYGVLGSFRNGTDYVPRTGPYELHRGESVTPARGTTVEDLVDALSKMNLTVMVGGKVIDERVEIIVDRHGLRRDAEWHAGKR